MTGNQDKAADLEGWAETVTGVLKAEIDDCVRAIAEGERLKAGDVAGVERKARAVGVIARSVRALLATAAAASRRGDDDTGGEAADRDDRPWTRERDHAELEHGLDQLHGRFDEADLVVEPGCWPVARAEREPARTS
jgi:hypothetical protein